MYTPHTYTVALLLMLVSMLCWGSWANTQKIDKTWRFELFYWDYMWGIVLWALLFGLTLGRANPAASVSFFHNLGSASARSLVEAFAGGVIFNLGNLLLVAAISVAGMAVAFPMGAGLALVIGAVLNYIVSPAGNRLLLFGGILLICAAIASNAMAYRGLSKSAKAGTKGIVLSQLCGVIIRLFYPFVAKALTGETTRHGLRDFFASIDARLAPRRIESWFQTPLRAARNIRFHYDRSNDLYRSFLDSRMVYSCAYFKDPGCTLDEAQSAKLDHICRKLDLRPEDRFLDVGCGWGALVVRAAEKYGARADGCTLSRQQDLFAAGLIAEKNLEDRVMVHECDYRSVVGRFNKIASVGMFEHLGRHRLRDYFRKISSLLDEEGLFLNRGIIRPEGTTDGPETLFLQKTVFPGGELACLSTVVREAGRAGFEILDVENLRPHYALTCRRWVERLQQNMPECLKHVDRETYRTWLLYLAGSAMSFETGATDLYQILMAKRRNSQFRRLTRDYIYV